MALRSWSKNKGLQQCRDVENQRRDVCRELQKRSIQTSRHCCTTSRRSGLILAQFLAHFEPIIMGFKDQTLEKQRTIGEWILGLFEGEQAPFGWKHPRACSWRDF